MPAHADWKLGERSRHVHLESAVSSMCHLCHTVSNRLRQVGYVSSQSRKPGFGDARVKALTGLRMAGVSARPDWLLCAFLDDMIVGALQFLSRLEPSWNVDILINEREAARRSR